MQSVFPSKCYAWWSPAFLEMVKHLCSWVVNEFRILLCLLSCPYLNPWFFSLLPFQFSPPSHQVWVSEQQLTKVNSQHRQNGTLQIVKMQTLACCKQWVEIWQLMRQCAGQERAGRNKEGVGRKVYKQSVKTHSSLQVYSTFSLPLPLLEPSLEHLHLHGQKIHCSLNVNAPWKKKPSKTQHFWPWQATL